MIQDTLNIRSKTAQKYLKENYFLKEESIFSSAEQIDWNVNDIQFIEPNYYFGLLGSRYHEALKQLKARNEYLKNKLDIDRERSLPLYDIEYIYNNIRKDNKIAIMIPNGDAFISSHGTRALKENMLNDGLIEEVIQLPPDHKLASTSIGYNSRNVWASIVVFSCDNKKVKMTLLSPSLGIISEDVSLVQFEKNDYNLLPSRLFIKKKFEGHKIYLGDIADIQHAYNLSRKTDSFVVEDDKTEATNIIYPVSIKDINNTMIERHISPIYTDDPTKFNKYRLEAGDVVFTAKGALFKSAMVDNDDRNLFATSNLYILKAKDNVCPELILAYLNSLMFDNYVNSICANRYFKAVKVGDLLAAPVAIDEKDLEKLNSKIKNGYAKYWKTYVELMKQGSIFMDSQKEEIDEIFKSPENFDYNIIKI